MKALLYATLTVLLLASCYDNSQIVTNEEIIIENPEVIITTALTGKVALTDGSILSDYIVTVGSHSKVVSGPIYTTGQLPELNKNSTCIKIHKDGALRSLKTVSLIENDLNSEHLTAFINIQRKNSAGEWKTKTEKLGIQSEVLTTGYFGQLPVDVTNHGYDAVGRLLSLEVQDGFYIEGIKDGSLTIESKSNDLEGVSLFKLSPKDTWVQLNWTSTGYAEGMDDGAYLLAKYEAGSHVEGSIYHQGIAISFQPYQINSSPITTHTTMSGKFHTVAPMDNEASLLTMNYCGVETGSYALSNLQNQTINTQNTEDAYHFVDIRIVGCPASDQTDMIFELDWNDNYATLFPYVNKKLLLPICSHDFDVIGYNYKENIRSAALPWSTEYIDQTLYLSLCEAHRSGFSYLEIGGDSKVYDVFEVVESDDKLSFTSMDNLIRLHLRDNRIGAFTTDMINIYLDDPSLGGGYFIACENAIQGCGFNQFEVTHLDENNGWIRAWMKGQLWMQRNNPRTAKNFDVEGQILIKR